jgi:hypothetical protein
MSDVSRINKVNGSFGSDIFTMHTITVRKLTRSSISQFIWSIFIYVYSYFMRTIKAILYHNYNDFEQIDKANVRVRWVTFVKTLNVRPSYLSTWGRHLSRPHRSSYLSIMGLTSGGLFLFYHHHLFYIIFSHRLHEIRAIERHMKNGRILYR